VEGGIVHGGKFEVYFNFFRSWVLPSSTAADHPRPAHGADETGRRTFYRETWDNLRWAAPLPRLLQPFRHGPARARSGVLRYVEGSVAERILERVE